MAEFTARELQAIRHIRNWLVHRGRTPSVRELMTALGYRSPRSAQDVLEQLAAKRVIKRFEGGDYQLLSDPELGSAHATTVDVPVVGTVAAGSPILADENIAGFIPISTTLARPGGKYFLLRVRGDSMNEAGINDHDYVLVRQQPTAAPGDCVVALIDEDATVKEYQPQKDVVVLRPRSTNPAHRPIIIHREFRIQGVVVATVPSFETNQTSR
jgi:repressor LexA